MKKSAIVFLAALTFAATAHAAPVAVFDQGHGQPFTVGKEGHLDLSKLAATFRTQGLEVATQTEPLDAEALASADALVLSGPFKNYTRPELNAILDFLNRGGRLAVMLHVASPAGELLQLLGVDYSNGVIREKDDIIADEALNYRVTRLEQDPVTAGIEHFSLYGGWALNPAHDNVKIIARTSPEAWVDLDANGRLTRGDAIGSFGVAVTGTYGKGSFIVFGDDGIFQNSFLDKDNTILAANLAGWLKSRD